MKPGSPPASLSRLHQLYKAGEIRRAGHQPVNVIRTMGHKGMNAMHSHTITTWLRAIEGTFGAGQKTVSVWLNGGLLIAVCLKCWSMLLAVSRCQEHAMSKRCTRDKL